MGKGSFFSTKIYRDHIDILLSELGYSELVQRLFEKMTFFRVDPLHFLSTMTRTTVRTTTKTKTTCGGDRRRPARGSSSGTMPTIATGCASPCSSRSLPSDAASPLVIAPVALVAFIALVATLVRCPSRRPRCRRSSPPDAALPLVVALVRCPRRRWRLLRPCHRHSFLALIHRAHSSPMSLIVG